MILHPDIKRVALLGWHLYPRARTSKAGAFKGAADAATCDLDRLAAWSRDYPGCGWRVVCGPSGLFALDVDRAGPTHGADGFDAMRELTRRHGALPPRPMTRSGGSGGAALFFAHRGEKLRGAPGTPAPGLDPHRGRQAVTIPPSWHPDTGGAYTWRVAPWHVAPPPIPAWLAAVLAPLPEPAAPAWRPSAERATTAVMRSMHCVADAPSGAANDTLNRAAYGLGRWVAASLLARSDAEAALADAARRRGIPAPEARATIRSGIAAGLRNPVQARA